MRKIFETRQVSQNRPIYKPHLTRPDRNEPEIPTIHGDTGAIVKHTTLESHDIDAKSGQSRPRSSRKDPECGLIREPLNQHQHGDTGREDKEELQVSTLVTQHVPDHPRQIPEDESPGKSEKKSADASHSPQVLSSNGKCLRSRHQGRTGKGAQQ